jgi:hypothetical protein
MNVTKTHVAVVVIITILALAVYFYMWGDDDLCLIDEINTIQERNLAH